MENATQAQTQPASPLEGVDLSALRPALNAMALMERMPDFFGPNTVLMHAQALLGLLPTNFVGIKSQDRLVSARERERQIPPIPPEERLTTTPRALDQMASDLALSKGIPWRRIYPPLQSEVR